MRTPKITSPAPTMGSHELEFKAFSDMQEAYQQFLALVRECEVQRSQGASRSKLKTLQKRKDTALELFQVARREWQEITSS